MSQQKGMTYAGEGVDYGAMDPHKRESLVSALETDHCLERFGFKPVPWTRGESVFLIEAPWGYLGLVVEGLGTKNIVADLYAPIAVEMERLTGRSFYDQAGWCNVAMAVNDAITLGARPFLYGQYLAVGVSNWFDDEGRRRDLIKGTRDACLQARCTWGGGEIPTLKGIIFPSAADLAGATVGIIPLKEQLINPTNIKHDDAIVIVESSGIHANGLTFARSIAEKILEGYLTKLPDGRTYGETLLDPTIIYVPLVEDCLDSGIKIHYTANITGHGWRKLMRATQSFAYVIERLPKPRPIFSFLQEHGPIDDREAYGNLNMGAGFALYVSEIDVDRVIDIATHLGYIAFRAGHIERSDEKKVFIKPLGLTYEADTLAVR